MIKKSAFKDIDKSKGQQAKKRITAGDSLHYCLGFTKKRKREVERHEENWYVDKRRRLPGIKRYNARCGKGAIQQLGQSGNLWFS